MSKTTPDDLETLAERVRRLERKNRWTRLMVALMVWLSGATAVFSGLVLVAPYSEAVRLLLPKNRTIEVERVLIDDADGNARAKLAVESDGSTYLALRGADGTPRAALRLLEDSTAGLVFWAKDGKTRVGLGLGTDGSSTFALADKDGKARASLGVQADGTSGLTLADPERPRADVSVEDGAPRFRLYDRDGKPRVRLGLGGDDVPFFNLADKDEQVVFKAP